MKTFFHSEQLLHHPQTYLSRGQMRKRQISGSINDDTERALFIVLTNIRQSLGKYRVHHCWHSD